MIDGIEIELTTEELRGHLTRRAAFYREVQRDCEALAAKQVGTDWIEAAKSDARHHGNKAEFYEYAAAHLIENEKYRVQYELFSRLFAPQNGIQTP